MYNILEGGVTTYSQGGFHNSQHTRGWSYNILKGGVTTYSKVELHMIARGWSHNILEGRVTADSRVAESRHTYSRSGPRKWGHKRFQRLGLQQTAEVGSHFDSMVGQWCHEQLCPIVVIPTRVGGGVTTDVHQNLLSRFERIMKVWLDSHVKYDNLVTCIRCENKVT